MKKALIISKPKNLVKKHFYVLVLLLITLIFFSGILSSSKILQNIHYISDVTFQSENIRKYLHESGAFPLWTPYFYSGQQFMAIPEHYLFDLNFLYIFLFNNVSLSMNLAAISYFFLAGLGMYLLAYELLKKQNAAFIAALIFMFNSLMQKFIFHGHLNILESYALIPFVFLFVYRALHRKSWINNAILAAVFFSMMIYAGGIIFFLYTGLISGLYMAWNLVSSNFKKIIIKTLLISVVIGILVLGLSALKLLPVLEFAGLSNRSAGVNFQEFLGAPISPANLWGPLVNLSFAAGFSGAIGITSFILLLFGLLSFRKKIVIFSILLIILAILLAAGTFVAEFFYKLPGFGQMRHIERALVMFVFAAPIIAAYGFNNLVSIVKKYKGNIKEWLIFSIVLLLLVVEVITLQTFPKFIEVVNPEDIPIVNEVSKDGSDFRIATYGMSTPIGASGYVYYSQLGIPTIKGGGGIWINDYVQYLAIAQQAAPSKMFGILNGKYIISDRKIDDSGLLLKGEFQDCESCYVWVAYGPYLYENKNVIPRASIVDNAILLLGNDNDKIEFSYSLIIGSLDPLSTVLIQDKNSINEYNIDELIKFNTIILLKDSVAQNDLPKLQRYADKGGKILPNLLEGINSISQQELADAFKSDSINKELKIKEISVNELAIDLNGEKGWLVLSEGLLILLDGKQQ
ncbi:hypothetical protein CMO94_01685 [Candidatus Woesearchaeota archaeon]|nr:hypothetical protein [Candidatus Woesearchaeota archaeon]